MYSTLLTTFNIKVLSDVLPDLHAVKLILFVLGFILFTMLKGCHKQVPLEVQKFLFNRN